MNKLFVARSQLMTAVHLHFIERDPVSVHTLAGAAQEILENLCDKKGLISFPKHIVKSNKDKSAKDIQNILNSYKNAFKHANKDDVELLKGFEETDNDHLIFVAVYDYGSYMNKLPVEFKVFNNWYYSLYTDVDDPKISENRVNTLKNFHKYFPDLKNNSRSVQKRLARDMILLALQNPETMRDPTTETPS